MPTPIRFLKARVKADYEVGLSWDFEAKLSDLPPEGVKFEPEKLGSVPLRGDWSLCIRNNGDELLIEVKHGRLAYAAFGERVTVMGEFAYLVDGTLRRIQAISWGERESEPGRKGDGTIHVGYEAVYIKSDLAAKGKLPLTVQSSLQRYRFSITWSQAPEEDVARMYHTSTPDLTKALQLAKLSHSPLMDVRLLFKQAGSRELELWTTADFLGKASGYYTALFASGAAETVSLRRSKRQRGPSVTSEQKPLARTRGPDPSVDWQDSDDEIDAFLVEHDWMSCTTTKQDTTELDYQQIEVRETAYSTMCAVLLYLQTGHIKLSSLSLVTGQKEESTEFQAVLVVVRPRLQQPTRLARSSHALSPDELVTNRKAVLVDALAEYPTLPPPVSPKSVYRLAHLLERDELQKMALDSLTSSLTISGAASELLSPATLAYDKLRKVVVNFVVKNWKGVEATEAWRAARAQMASGQTEGGAQILLDLLVGVGNT